MTEENENLIPFKLQAQLERNNMNATQLAYKTGMSYGLIYKLLRGYTDNTSLKTAKKIAKVLKCKIEDIF